MDELKLIIKRQRIGESTLKLISVIVSAIFITLQVAIVIALSVPLLVLIGAFL